ncbi:MAG: nucleoside deaminase [Pseudomonadota bacterium]|nr:nucleoside deaminase [Pseudomonadota bacterium]
MLELQPLMQQAIEVARQSAAAGEPPFGAIIVGPTGERVAALGDQVRMFRDMTRHAEIEIVRIAIAVRGPDLRGCSLVTTVEPCPMCFTAAWLARITRIVYGATMSAVAAATDGAQREVIVPVEQMNAASGNQIEVIGGIHGHACLSLFSPSAIPAITLM